MILSLWGIDNKPYWYKLYDCRSNDVITFNEEYIKDDNNKVLNTGEALIKQGDVKILEMDEKKRLIYIRFAVNK